MSASSPLADRLARLIRRTGPIPLQAWMAEANAHYYATRDPLGAAGDFVTAPEVSQMFGELIGLALADCWHRAGAPADAIYVELGPGRGTLARDALRAMTRAGLSPEPWLVEGSPVLRARQAELVPNARFAEDFAAVPADGRPILLVANEFLDALPIRQAVRTPAGWRERCVALEAAGEGGDAEGRFIPIAGDRPLDAAIPPEWTDAPAGSIIETCPAALAQVSDIAGQIALRGGAALVIDYGHGESRLGSTFQAVRGHARADPFSEPGAADLTALVDFAPLLAAARDSGCRATLTTQGQFLEMLGIAHREAALSRANPARAADFAGQRHRLTDPEEMGALFKVLAFTAPGWPPLAGA